MQDFRSRFEQKQIYTGCQLFSYCQALAQQRKQFFPGKPLLPGGARIYYYTRRLLLAQGSLPEVNPDETVLPEHIVERFLRTTPLVAERLATEFPRAVQIRAALGQALQSGLSRGPMLSAPELTWIPADLDDNNKGIQQIWERLWETCWRAAAQEYLARLWVLMRSDRLPVAPVARLGDPTHVALRLLRAQLAQDAERGWHVPPAGAYLYDELLEAWLLRSLMTDQWFSRLCQALTEHIHQVSG